MILPPSLRSLSDRLWPSQPYTTRRDRAIARRLHVTFERDFAPAVVDDLHFYTYKGIVTIYGTTRHALDRDLLVALIRAIPGVRGVSANLHVADGDVAAAGAPAPAPAPEAASGEARGEAPMAAPEDETDAAA